MQAARAQMECTWEMINPAATPLEATPVTPGQSILTPVPFNVPEEEPQVSGDAEEDARVDFARQQTALMYTRTSDM